MNRRELLVAGGTGALLGIVGCLDEDTDDRGVDAPLPKRDEFPDRPDELDTESVLEYVTEYERTVTEVPPLSDQCDATHVSDAVEYEEGIYVGLPCKGQVLYLVTDAETHRIELDVSRADVPSAEDLAERHRTAIVLANFHDTARSPSVQLSYDDDGETVPVLDDSYSLARESGIYLTDVTARFADYELRVDPEEGSAVHESVRVNRLPVDLFRAICVTPDGDPVVREMAFSGFRSTP